MADDLDLVVPAIMVADLLVHGERGCVAVGLGRFDQVEISVVSRSERQLCGKVHVNLAYRWAVGWARRRGAGSLDFLEELALRSAAHGVRTTVERCMVQDWLAAKVCVVPAWSRPMPTSGAACRAASGRSPKRQTKRCGVFGGARRGRLWRGNAGRTEVHLACGSGLTLDVSEWWACTRTARSTLRVKIRDEGLVRNMAAHIALGVRADGS